MLPPRAPETQLRSMIERLSVSQLPQMYVTVQFKCLLLLIALVFISNTPIYKSVFSNQDEFRITGWSQSSEKRDRLFFADRHPRRSGTTQQRRHSLEV